MSKIRPLGIVHRPGCTKPDVREHCKCGENRSCVTCGWGTGSWPCKCSREREAKRERTDPSTMDFHSYMT
jgi:hypothetical protein